MTDVWDRYEKERECQNRQAGPRRPVLCFEPTESPLPPQGSASLYQTAWRGGGCCGAVTHLLLAPPPPFSEKPCCVFASQLLENSVHSCVVFAG